MTCRCCHRPFTEFDADEVLADEATGAAILILAPSTELCGPFGDPESRPWAHLEAHSDGDRFWGIDIHGEEVE